MSDKVREAFVVKHYSADERPTIKGNGFDGLEIGRDREEAEEFVAWINAALAKQAAPAAEQAEHGELHPDSARDAARTMLNFVRAFLGERFQDAPVKEHDRHHLGIALDHLEEAAAMILNLADRVPTEQAAKPAALTDEQIRKLWEQACTEWTVGSIPNPYLVFARATIAAHQRQLDADMFAAISENAKDLYDE